MEMEGGVMVTLDDLKEAVAEYDDNGSLHEVVQETIILFARDYIAREQLLDTELTAEICERLGMVKTEQAGVWYVSDHERSALIGSHGERLVLKGAGPEPIEKPTIRHLLAAACLAGVTVDLSRLDQPAIDI
jgi:hypothetical protein